MRHLTKERRKDARVPQEAGPQITEKHQTSQSRTRASSTHPTPPPHPASRREPGRSKAQAQVFLPHEKHATTPHSATPQTHTQPHACPTTQNATTADTDSYQDPPTQSHTGPTEHFTSHPHPRSQRRTDSTHPTGAARKTPAIPSTPSPSAPLTVAPSPGVTCFRNR